MVDALIYDAQDKLKEFAKAWSGRAKEFHNLQMYGEAGDAHGLAHNALTKSKGLRKLLKEDKLLDKQYDKIKA